MNHSVKHNLKSFKKSFIFSGDLLSRFGGLLVQFHSSLLGALSPQLKSPRLAVRKRSIIALGHLVMSCDQPLYLQLIDILLNELATSNGGGHSTQNTRTYIQVRLSIEMSNTSFRRLENNL